MKNIVAVISALLVTTPALATPSPQDDPELYEHGVLVSLIERLGVPVEFDSQRCRQDKNVYGYYNHDGSVLVACPLGDRTERLGTIRHEAWHFYQDISDCSIKDVSRPQVALANGIVPVFNTNAWSKQYQAEEMKPETEARWVELNYTANAISVMIAAKAQACGFRF